MSKYRFPFFFFSINFNRSRKRDESDEVYDSKFCETILKIFQFTFINDYNVIVRKKFEILSYFSQYTSPFPIYVIPKDGEQSERKFGILNRSKLYLYVYITYMYMYTYMYS